MTKTPEQLAEEWMNEEYGDTSHWVRMGKDMSIDAFLAGYKAAKDEMLSKGMQGYITEIRNDAWCTAMQLGQQSQWISVKDRLPEDGQDVLVFDEGTISVKSLSSYTHKWHPYENGFDCEPSHWMSLPAAPKEEA